MTTKSMTFKHLALAIFAALVLSAAPGLALVSAQASTHQGTQVSADRHDGDRVAKKKKKKKAKKFKNCEALNKVYPHGVGRPGAVDSTSGEPVTNFTRNKKVYNKNKKGRDRDKDGIACEKL